MCVKLNRVTSFEAPPLQCRSSALQFAPEYQFNECRVEITPALPLILPRWSYYITEPQEHYTLYNSIANVDNLSRGLYLFLLLLHEYLA